MPEITHLTLRINFTALGITLGWVKVVHCVHNSRRWIGGETVQALAYDVPIPGYKTKNTISLRLWEAKARAGDFDLFQFNDGQYESAAQLHSRAQQVCYQLIYLKDCSWDWVTINNSVLWVHFPISFYKRDILPYHFMHFQICAVLYPGDATENGKLLRLKQQFFLCSASLQVWKLFYFSWW